MHEFNQLLNGYLNEVFIDSLTSDYYAEFLDEYLKER